MAWISMMDVMYPVGSVYMNISSISPAETVGGTWVKIESGFLGSAGTAGLASAGQTGGSFTMTISQMPSHEHKCIRKNAGGTWDNIDFQFSNVGSGGGWLVPSGGAGTGRDLYASAVGGGNRFTPSIFQSICGKELHNFPKGGYVKWLM